jgi:hypothetical protein
LEKISLQKAIGPDDIPNWVLKSAAPLLAGPICSTFNASIAQGCIPTLWKPADVIPVPKTSNPKSVDSDLRPISLTPVLSQGYFQALFYYRYMVVNTQSSIEF